ncbi:MAG TPA: hypothetical protein VHU88_11320 [Sporichthyaceae bacterium]|jgi:hypothetical protein|nr:hypothetical protein [Sporichthyaceae bacterium]
MTRTTASRAGRALTAVLLAGGFATAVSAYELQSAAAAPAPGSEAPQPLTECGIAQLTPRVPAADPVLGRAQQLFDGLAAGQQVAPALRDVYASDPTALNIDQRHEVLLFLSSLNQCPGLDQNLQADVLGTFDRLAPEPVTAQPADVRADDSTVGGDPDWCWDGNWNGHPWWFRPYWDQPVLDRQDWVRWGHDRVVDVAWLWTGSTWDQYGRQGLRVQPSQPWLPTVVSRARLPHEPAQRVPAEQVSAQPPAAAPAAAPR